MGKKIRVNRTKYVFIHIVAVSCKKKMYKTIYNTKNFNVSFLMGVYRLSEQWIEW